MNFKMMNFDMIINVKLTIKSFGYETIERGSWTCVCRTTPKDRSTKHSTCPIPIRWCGRRRRRLRRPIRRCAHRRRRRARRRRPVSSTDGASIRQDRGESSGCRARRRPTSPTSPSRTKSTSSWITPSKSIPTRRSATNTSIRGPCSFSNKNSNSRYRQVPSSISPLTD